MSKFTKGKWSVEYGIDIKSGIHDDAYIAQLFFLGERFDEEAANGRLIAAAPEMYELLKVCAKTEESGNYIPAFLDLKNKALELLARIDVEDDKHD